MAVPAAAPPVCQPKGATNGHYPAPRLSISSRATVVARMEGAPQGGLRTVMKWKTVVAIFVVVVVYLVTGGLVFRALEQPFESSQKNTIALEKAEFLRDHVCVSPQELETLIQVSRAGVNQSHLWGQRTAPILSFWFWDDLPLVKMLLMVGEDLSGR